VVKQKKKDVYNMFSWLWRTPPPPPPPPPEADPDTYDVIVMLRLHSSTYAEEEHGVLHPSIIDIPEDKNVTFLDSSPCGVYSISSLGEFLIDESNIVKWLKEFGPTKSLAEHCQQHLKARKKLHLKLKIHDKLLSEFSDYDCNEYKRRLGWEIITTKRIIERFYVPEEIYSDKINIVYSIRPLLPPGNIVSYLETPLSRFTLLKYLYKHGAKNPLIIDYSCGGVCGVTPRKIRSLRNEAYKETNTTNTKRLKPGKTGGSTKRPQVKKLGHFTKHLVANVRKTRRRAR